MSDQSHRIASSDIDGIRVDITVDSEDPTVFYYELTIPGLGSVYTPDDIELMSWSYAVAVKVLETAHSLIGKSNE